ncbi:MAG: AAA family ATPase [Ruminiclostridium sp.]|nr:AAA family ATPase [Ruminiclostridium sp.]MBQ9933606.1 AAA family ATPase [Ruminiclostridium sp.]
MIYLSHFTLPRQELREGALAELVKNRTCYNNFYPFQVFRNWEEETFSLEPITVFYGGNGSGKTTLLNLIGEKLRLERRSVFNSSSFFPNFVDLCRAEGQAPEGSAVLTSDDVFDDLLDLRSLNQGIDRERLDLLAEYKDLRESGFRMTSLDDYDQLQKVVRATRRKASGSSYVKESIGTNVRGKSNGETAFKYFTDQIQDNALYLLDEPENSLSVQRQRELAQFLEDSARFFGCQIILATHSPILLSMKGARVYDLDQRPIQTRKWTDLPAVRAWHEFFQAHADEF